MVSDGNTAGGQRSHEGHKIPNKGGPEELRGPGKNSQVRDMLGYTFFTSFLAWVIQHASVWLHCLEELQGLVQVMAAFTLIHRGATGVRHQRARTATHPSLLRHEDKRTPRKENKGEIKATQGVQEPMATGSGRLYLVTARGNI